MKKSPSCGTENIEISLLDSDSVIWYLGLTAKFWNNILPLSSACKKFCEISNEEYTYGVHKNMFQF